MRQFRRHCDSAHGVHGRVGSAGCDRSADLSGCGGNGAGSGVFRYAARGDIRGAHGAFRIDSSDIPVDRLSARRRARQWYHQEPSSLLDNSLRRPRNEGPGRPADRSRLRVAGSDAAVCIERGHADKRCAGGGYAGAGTEQHRRTVPGRWRTILQCRQQPYRRGGRRGIQPSAQCGGCRRGDLCRGHRAVDDERLQRQPGCARALAQHSATAQQQWLRRYAGRAGVPGRWACRSRPAVRCHQQRQLCEPADRFDRHCRRARLRCSAGTERGTSAGGDGAAVFHR